MTHFTILAIRTIDLLGPLAEKSIRSILEILIRRGYEAFEAPLEGR